jgi:hypothetical protein
MGVGKWALDGKVSGEMVGFMFLAQTIEFEQGKKGNVQRE